MRITYIAAGAAGMYCGSCIHDNTLATALIKKGHDVLLVPTYTPLRTDEDSVSLDSVFYGAVNVYLQQKLPPFRLRALRFLDSLLDKPGLLKYVSRFSSATSAKDLGGLTLSILRGEVGHQRQELQKLVRWMEQEQRPDLVQLTNSMFLGLAKEIKNRLNVPVLCSLQGEDIFLEDLPDPYKTDAKKTLRERAQDVDGFVATSSAYADFMSDYLGVERTKIHVVPLGISLEGHAVLPRQSTADKTRIGYLARICPEKGLHLLVDAFDLLVQRVGHENLQLEVAGYLGGRDRAYFEELTDRISSSSWAEYFRYRGEVDREEKLQFLSSVDLLSVPTVYRDPKGLFVLEALASGVPVVQPNHGGFPELIEKTGGGILVEPNSPAALADGLQQLVENKERRQQLGKQGRASVREHFNDESLADRALAVYEQYLPERANGKSGKR